MTPGALSIRSAAVDDAPTIQAIYAPIVVDTVISFETEPPSAELMAERIAATLAAYPYLVAERDGAVVGYAYASQHRARSAYNISADVTAYVAACARGQRVGHALYAALLPEMAGRGLHAATAGITLPNAASVALHESFGFHKVAVFPEIGRKFGAYHDVGWWQKLL
ncbi:N-acetyltransferase family protein [Acuticoccus sp. MNP-M23]|uniref:arsinothricin resistance N-acetyltransferase ArsN1 family B n=1 Tax=Acuticoccus sp. MNP-M23 TaxID=3072793 RepID=UPI002815D009|nr:arsinothricin resistance N-acetyltransferase ArsN1 family B [Acuticoccus sp. MNP-M23]WMS42186.1 N-acetyltransferase family protein [Acuticoccus sp. MNP-M23]